MMQSVTLARVEINYIFIRPKGTRVGISTSPATHTEAVDPHPRPIPPPVLFGNRSFNVQARSCPSTHFDVGFPDKPHSRSGHNLVCFWRIVGDSASSSAGWPCHCVRATTTTAYQLGGMDVGSAKQGGVAQHPLEKVVLWIVSGSLLDRNGRTFLSCSVTVRYDFSFSVSYLGLTSLR